MLRFNRMVDVRPGAGTRRGGAAPGWKDWRTGSFRRHSM